jgi:hypothetical protein
MTVTLVNKRNLLVIRKDAPLTPTSEAKSYRHKQEGGASFPKRRGANRRPCGAPPCLQPACAVFRHPPKPARLTPPPARRLSIGAYRSVISAYGSVTSAYGSVTSAYGSVTSAYRSVTSAYGSLISAYGSVTSAYGSLISAYRRCQTCGVRHRVGYACKASVAVKSGSMALPFKQHPS